MAYVMRIDSFSSSTISVTTSKHQFVSKQRLLKGRNLLPDTTIADRLYVNDIASSREVNETLQIEKRQKLQHIVTRSVAVFLVIAFVYLSIFN